MVQNSKSLCLRFVFLRIALVTLFSAGCSKGFLSRAPDHSNIVNLTNSTWSSSNSAQTSTDPFSDQDDSSPATTTALMPSLDQFFVGYNESWFAGEWGRSLTSGFDAAYNQKIRG